MTSWIRTATVLAALVFPVAAPTAALALDPPMDLVGVWRGSAACEDGTRYFRVSTEPDDGQYLDVIDFLDTPDGRPWARATGGFYAKSNGSVNLANQSWQFRPLEKPAWPGFFTPSEDRNTLTSQRDLPGCGKVVLTRAPDELARGGIRTAADLPPVLEGVLRCKNGRPWATARLTLEGDGGDVEGVMEYSPHPDYPQTEGGIFSVFGEFDEASGRLLLIGDRWIDQRGRNDEMFGFEGSFRDRGMRLKAVADLRSCGAIDLNVPGTGATDGIVPPVPPRPILDWDGAEACVTLISWADQALQEAGLPTFYRGITVDKVRDFGAGLFSDARFVPYFGKSFGDLTPEENEHVQDLADMCSLSRSYGSIMNRVGASRFVSDYFRDTRKELALTAQKVRLLSKRMNREMAALADRDVGEADIDELRASLAELDDRFGILWSTDRAPSRALLEAKLEAAAGKLAARLEGDIDDLPSGIGAFRANDAIAADIARLGEASAAERGRLAGLLEKRLDGEADAVLTGIASEFAAADRDLVTLGRLRARLNEAMPLIAQHRRTRGEGVATLDTLMSEIAEAAYPAFEAEVTGFMASADTFEDRQIRYRQAVGRLNATVPAADAYGRAFARYTALVGSLRPEPTLKDLVAADGSPTALGLRLAMSDWVSDVYATTFQAFFPYDLSFLLESLKVSSVRKHRCAEATGGGYWCDYGMSMDGDFPFLGLLSLMPYEGRFVLSGETWALVETAKGYVGPTDMATVSRLMERSR